MPHGAVTFLCRRRAACSLAVLAVAACMSGCSRLWGTPITTYYVSPSGSDKADGTSPQTAWRTLARASAARLKPGTRLLIQGGHRYLGELKLGPKDGGSPRNPVRVGSYGAGPAVIVPAGGPGILVFNTAGIDINGMDVTGRRPIRPDSAGIELFSSQRAGHRLSHILIENVNVS